MHSRRTYPLTWAQILRRVAVGTLLAATMVALLSHYWQGDDWSSSIRQAALFSAVMGPFFVYQNRP